METDRRGDILDYKTSHNITYTPYTLFIYK